MLSHIVLLYRISTVECRAGSGFKILNIVVTDKIFAAKAPRSLLSRQDLADDIEDCDLPDVRVV